MSSDGASGADRSDNSANSSDRGSSANSVSKDTAEKTRNAVSGNSGKTAPEATAADRAASQGKMKAEGKTAKDRVEQTQTATTLEPQPSNGTLERAPQRRGEFSVAPNGDVTFIDKGGHTITLQGRGPTAEQRASYSQQDWDMARRSLSMDINRRSSFDHGQDMTFDERPPQVDPVQYVKGVRDTGRGLARCPEHCEAGYELIAELAKDPKTSGLVADALLEAAAKNPEYAAGRATPGTVAATGTALATKNLLLSGGVGTSVQFSAIAGDLGYMISEAEKNGIVLTNKQIVDAIRDGLTTLD